MEFRDVGAWPAYVSFFRHKMPAHLYNEQLMFCNPYDAILKEQDGEIVPVSNFHGLSTKQILINQYLIQKIRNVYMLQVSMRENKIDIHSIR